MKYTKKFNRSYNFYLLNRDRYNFCGEVVTVLEDLKDGVTGKESFYSLDTFGVMLPTNEPDLLRSIIICKKSINLHIQMWVEGFEDMMMSVEYYMNLFEGTETPSWIEKSFRKQLQKRIRRLREDRISKLK